MSTFKGIVSEFPEIRIDFFARQEGVPPPLANFLSHVHSDHLTGLAGKSYGAPFIYCSAATKRLLLRLQRKAHRYNVAKNLVECHSFSYLDLPGNRREKLLRDIPLETPTEIELRPGYAIRVTLFDANHCPGATMFLIEGNGRAILYTGDVRAEGWWVQNLIRHPVMVPYATGIQILDKIYLDTTHADPGAKHLVFSPKAEGIAELIRQVEKYPADTIFHFNTWTFGYEDAWVALASRFRTQIHVDDWRYNMFRSVRDKSSYEHGPFLCGFAIGNSTQKEVLTKDVSVRFHSCERGISCKGLQPSKRVVHISPVIMKHRDPKTNQVIILKELGEQGGGGDLNTLHYLECDRTVLALLHSVAPLETKIKIERLVEMKQSAIPLNIDFEDERALSINEIANLLQKSLDSKDEKPTEGAMLPISIAGQDTNLPEWFGFPYSRHSSYNELRDLVGAFKPQDVYPCVVPDAIWHQERSIEALFGDLCSGTVFAFDGQQENNVEARLRDQQNIDERNLAMRREAGLDLESSLCESEEEISADDEPIENILPNQIPSQHKRRRSTISSEHSVDDEAVKQAFLAVFDPSGRAWNEQSSAFGFNNSSWRYEREDEL